MQALAVGLFAGFLADIQVVYPAPRTYQKPGRYTEGCRALHEISLDVFASVKPVGPPDEAIEGPVG